MSASLYVEPYIEKEFKGITFGHPLKGILSKRFLNHDGSCGSDTVILSEKDVPFLEGVKAAGSTELGNQITEILVMIEKFNAVKIWTS